MSTEPIARVWGKPYASVEEMQERVAKIAQMSKLYGDSDDRVSETQALAVAIKKVSAVRASAEAERKAQTEARRAAREAEQVRQYRGYLIRKRSTRTTHFVNVWGESFCGRFHQSDSEMDYVSGEGRATCRTCQKAGDAVLREGTYAAGGSAARRN